MNRIEKVEWQTCKRNPRYFANKYCQIYDSEDRGWIPFDLWPAQARTLKTIQTERLVVILKARQLGLTWLCLSFALQQMLFHPQAEVLLFSRRDDEAVYLLDDRLKGMYSRLPRWMQARSVVSSNDHEFALSNGSTARAFPTSAGDSYTATLVIVDEADLIPDFNRLMRAVKPTIDTGGRMVLLSRTDKTQPESEFKRIYRASKGKDSPWVGVFLPWHMRPVRDTAWYEAQRQDIESRTGALDDLYEQYPATDTEALAPRSLDKRIPAQWIEMVYAEETGAQVANQPTIPGLTIYRRPIVGKTYVCGVDPAEGNPTSDDSALTVLDVMTGEECAVLRGKFQPAVMASHADKVGIYYNHAPIMVERNNHGHAVIMWLDEHSRLALLHGRDDRVGWLSNQLGKSLLYDGITDYFRDAARDGAKLLHSFATYTQLASIEGSTLRAPKGQYDDLADSYALAEVGRAEASAVAGDADLLDSIFGG